MSTQPVLPLPPNPPPPPPSPPPPVLNLYLSSVDREVVRRYKDSKELRPLFCVETSCLLVEVAWQAYYDPHHANLDDFIAPGLQDLSYLGLELVVSVAWGRGGGGEGGGILALLLLRHADLLCVGGLVQCTSRGHSGVFLRCCYYVMSICCGWVGWFIGHLAGLAGCWPFSGLDCSPSSTARDFSIFRVYAWMIISTA